MTPRYLTIFWLVTAVVCALLGNWLALAACLGAAGAEMQLVFAE